MAKRPRRRVQTIRAEEKPLRECTCAEIAEHLKNRDQVVFVFAYREVHDNSGDAVIDECAWSGQLFEMLNALLQKAKKLREEEGHVIDEDEDA